MSAAGDNDEHTCVFFPERGEPRIVRERWDRGAPFDRTEYFFLTDRRADEAELSLLSKCLTRRGFWGASRWLRRHLDEVRKCPEEYDPRLVPLMAYWTVAYDENALRMNSRAAANRALNAVGLPIMGDAYVFLNIEHKIGSQSAHIIDADLVPNAVDLALEAARDFAAQS